MAWSRRKKRLIIIAGSILLLLIIFIVSANALLSHRADAFIREKLSTIDTTDYKIDFKRVRINIFTRSVRLYDVTVSPQPIAIEHVRLSRLAKPVYEIRLEKLVINNVSISGALSGESYQIRRILLDRPQVKVYGSNPIFSRVQNEVPDKESITADSIFGQVLGNSSLGSLRIKDGSFSWMDMSREKEVMITKGIDISLEEISFSDSSRQLPLSMDIEGFEIAFESNSMELPGAYYQLETASMNISYENSEILIDSFRLIPAYEKGSFGKTYGKQTDRFDLYTDQIRVRDIIFDSLMKKKVIINEILISRPWADIYRDKRVDRDMSIFPKLFQTSVASLPVLLDINNIKLDNSTLKYQEMVHDSKVPGYVEFDQMDITIEGINNSPQKIREGQSMLIKANARLMKTSHIEAYFDLPIGRSDELFTFQGKTGPFPANSLNPMMEPLAYLGFSAGAINSVEFYGLAMNDTAVGRIEFLYSDLEIMVIKKDQMRKGEVKENRLLSSVTKALLHKNNPMGNDQPRIAKMEFVRDPNKGFFNYFWKTVQNGLVNTILPAKKKHTYDMDWTSFKNNWYNVLMQDREDLKLQYRKRKNRK